MCLGARLGTSVRPAPTHLAIRCSLHALRPTLHEPTSPRAYLKRACRFSMTDGSVIAHVFLPLST